MEELADVLEVAEAIRKQAGISDRELQICRNTKAEKNGRFEKKIFLECIIENKNSWQKFYGRKLKQISPENTERRRNLPPALFRSEAVVYIAFAAWNSGLVSKQWLFGDFGLYSSFLISSS